MWPRVLIRTPAATATLTCSLEREQERERERARARARTAAGLRYGSVVLCLSGLSGGVVARRVPPPVSARSGRSFFSLAIGWLPLSRATLGRCWGASALSFRLWLNRGWGGQLVELKVPKAICWYPSAGRLALGCCYCYCCGRGGQRGA